MYRLEKEVYIFHTNYNLYETTWSSELGIERFYIYASDLKTWVEFVPQQREFQGAEMPQMMKDVILFAVDFWIPLDDGTILITGKNLYGEEKNRIIAGGLFIFNLSAGKVIKVIKGTGKVIGKGAKYLSNKAVELVTKKAENTINLLDNKLIQELKEKGIKFTEENLKFLTKNSDGIIIFLEKGNATSGLEHIIKGKWNDKTNFQKLFNNSVDEMVNNIYKAIKNEKYIKKNIDEKNRISYIYKIETRQGFREFKIAIGSNGYIVSFIPNW